MSPFLPLMRWTFLLPLFALLAVAFASTGDRNPTFQHCLKGCTVTYCDPSSPPIPFYLRAFGWSCLENCKYQCAHSFTDHIRQNSAWVQFYGKWPFYRLGPIQEPFSVLMSLGNLYVNLQGLIEVRRRIRPENKLRRWLEIAGWAQINTWIWSAVFHSRDTPFTERMDYFSATITVSLSLIYAILRVLQLQTPSQTSKLALPAVAIVAFLVLSHLSYLLSFPLGQFPYGYHTKFVVILGIAHNLLWILWSLSFKFRYPSITIGNRRFAFPKPYPPTDPLLVRSGNSMTPMSLVVLTLFAMSFELFDFRPLLRVVDAHALWHLFTIPLALGWWTFFIQDALDMEAAALGQPISAGGPTLKEKVLASRSSRPPASSSLDVSSSVSTSVEERRAPSPRTPTIPMFAQVASMPPPPRRTPGKSPKLPSKGDRED